VAEGNIPGGPPVRAAAPVVAPQWPGVALFAVVCAAFCACHWAIAWPAKPVASFWVEQARGIGIVMMLFALPAGLVTRKPPGSAIGETALHPRPSQEDTKHLKQNGWTGDRRRKPGPVSLKRPR
jgi:hypothetical protein